MPTTPLSTILLIAAIAFVLAMRFRRMRHGRRLRPDRLWIVPVLMSALIATMLYAAPPRTGLDWALAGGGLALGALLGWQRGRLVRIDHDPDTGHLIQRESPLALVLIVAIILARGVARGFAAQEAAVLHITPFAIADALGLIVMQRIVLWRRATAVLAG